MNLRIAGIERESFVDGEGIRFAVFVQGCSRHCPGCHNQITWDPYKGHVVDIEEISNENQSVSIIHNIK